MADERDRVPKEGDRVRTPNVKDGFVVVAVREHPNVVETAYELEQPPTNCSTQNSK